MTDIGLSRGAVFVPTQPAFPIIYVKVGDIEATVFANNVVNTIKVTRKVGDTSSEGGGGNEVVITLVDETTIALEAEVSMSTDKKIQYWYGYSEGKRSKMYSAIIQEAFVEFTSWGSRLTIRALSEEVVGASKTSARAFAYQSPSDIVQSLANSEGWKLGIIEPTEMVYEDDSTSVSAKRYPISGEVPTGLDKSKDAESVDGGVERNITTRKTPKVFSQNNQTSIEFITNDLIPYSVSSRTKSSSYKLWFDQDGEDSIVNYATVDRKAEIDNANKTSGNTPSQKFIFKWGSSDDTTVLSFTPSYNIIGNAYGESASDVSVSTINALTNAMFNFSYGRDSNPWDVGGKITDPVLNYKTKIGGSSYTASQLERLAASIWYTRSTNEGGTSASMVILGDPDLVPMTLISVIIIDPGGLPHHTSGIYIIKSIEDNIEGGKFTSTLELAKNNLDVKVSNSGKMTIAVGSGQGTSDGSGAISDQQGSGSGSTSGGVVGGVGAGATSTVSGDAKKYLEYALSLKGTPYVWGGSNLNTHGGLDCSGYIYWCLKHIGRRVDRQTTYTMNTENGYGVNRGSSISNATPGCSLVGTWGGSDPESHVMIYLGNGRVVHAPQPGEVIKEGSIEGYRISRILDPFGYH